MGVDLSAWNRAFQGEKKGAFETRNRAFQTWRALDKFVEKNKWSAVTPTSITPKQMRLFLESRAEQVGARSVQNEASHLRRALAGAGRDLGDVRDPKNGWSNERMGVESASRKGEKPAMNPIAFEEARGRLSDGVRACVDLQSALGLRRQESLQSGRSLDHWARELTTARVEGRGAFIQVSDGTKGGRSRSTWVPPDRLEKVIEAVNGAREAKSGQYIVAGVDLKAAKALYSNELSRAGLTGKNSGHGLRRAFAHAQFRHYRDSGFDEANALVRLSRDLGHGDGRGRWVWNNYLSGGEG
jgi:integrase